MENNEAKSGLPHDKFVRKVFSKKKNLVDFLNNALPQCLYDKIDIDSIHLSKDSFIGNKYISKQLGEFYSDKLVNLKLDGKDTRCGILIEHKSEYYKFT
ncbi:MAG: Rpn family recombination-promoting nuclease/putative transposase, partial [Spirochaetota bacterium]